MRMNMKYKIIVDSCCDLTEELKMDQHFQVIPLTLQVGDTYMVDDETFDQARFLKLVDESAECPKSACPSPESFKLAYEAADAEGIFVVTLSQHLSGTYNSAQLAKNLYEEEHGKDKKIAVFSSDSAASGESLIALKIQELCEAGLSFEEVVEQISGFRDHMLTYFVLENLDTLRKNGRLSGLQALFATALNIKPVMAGDHGVIVKLDQARGINKALNKMIDLAVKSAVNTEKKILGITHCNCLERALYVKDEICRRLKCKDIYIVDAAGVSSMYANEGGIVMCL